jgi:hypothetical protein
VQSLAASVLLMVASVTDATQELHLSGLSLELPGAWTVKTDGQYVVRGSLSPTFDPNVMPWVTVNLCDDESANHRCPAGKPDLSRDKGCPAIQRSVHEWPNAIVETRWVCPLMRDRPGIRYSSSVTLFEIGKTQVLLYYLATDHDTPPTEFLDNFAKALRIDATAPRGAVDAPRLDPDIVTPPQLDPETVIPTATRLLQTLKQALDSDQLLQEAFFSDENLKSLFDATSIQWFTKDDDPPRIGKIVIIKSALLPGYDIRVSSLFVPGASQARRVLIAVGHVRLTREEVIAVFGAPVAWTRGTDPHGASIPLPLHFGDVEGVTKTPWDGTVKKGASFSIGRDGSVNSIMIVAIGPEKHK